MNRFAQEIEVASQDVLEILRDARALITDPDKWASDGAGSGEQRCAIRALIHVAPSVSVDHPAEVALRAAMGGYIATFNDSHTHAEVLAAFDKAIASLEVEFAGIKRPRAACDGRGHDTEGVISDAPSRLREGVDGRAGAFRPVSRRAGTPARRSRHITGLVDHQNR